MLTHSSRLPDSYSQLKLMNESSWQSSNKVSLNPRIMQPFPDIKAAMKNERLNVPIQDVDQDKHGEYFFHVSRRCFQTKKETEKNFQKRQNTRNRW